MRVQLFIDHKRRELFSKTEFFRRFLKCLKCFKNKLFIKNIILFKHLFFYSRIKNICWVTGRSRSVYKHFRVSRFVMKGVSRLGVLQGLKKTNW